MTSKEIQRDHSDNAIRDAIQDNILTFIEQDFSYIPEPYSSQFIRGEDMVRWFTGIPHPMFNNVFAFQFNEQGLEDRIGATIEYFRSRKVPHMWYIGPNSTPSNIEEALVNQGLKKSEWDSPAMAVDLRQLDDSKLQELSDRSGAKVSKVETGADLERYMDVFNNTFMMGDEAARALHSVHKVLLKDIDKCHIFLAEIDGEPAGVSMSILRAGVAGVYNVGTLEKYRGKGIGSLVSLAAVLECRNKGYEIGMLLSSELGFNVYSRIGFKEYFKYRIYIDIIQ